jgi:hypothetical protein
MYLHATKRYVFVSRVVGRRQVSFFPEAPAAPARRSCCASSLVVGPSAPVDLPTHSPCPPDLLLLILNQARRLEKASRVTFPWHPSACPVELRAVPPACRASPADDNLALPLPLLRLPPSPICSDDAKPRRAPVSNSTAAQAARAKRKRAAAAEEGGASSGDERARGGKAAKVASGGAAGTASSRTALAAASSVASGSKQPVVPTPEEERITKVRPHSGVSRRTSCFSGRRLTRFCSRRVDCSDCSWTSTLSRPRRFEPTS